jgi:hypothetical protein
MPELLGEKYIVAISTQLQMKGSLNLDTQSSVNITPDASILSAPFLLIPPIEMGLQDLKSERMLASGVILNEDCVSKFNEPFICNWVEIATIYFSPNNSGITFTLLCFLKVDFFFFPQIEFSHFRYRLNPTPMEAYHRQRKLELQVSS